MTKLQYEDIQKGDKLYFARIMPKFGYYEIHDVVMVTKYDDHCTVTETKTKQSFLLGMKDIESKLYSDKDKALTYLKDEQKKNKNVKTYTKSKDDSAESED